MFNVDLEIEKISINYRRVNTGVIKVIYIYSVCVCVCVRAILLISI